MDVAFILNPTGLEGLGATLVSLTRNCSDTNSLAFWFFCSDCGHLHKDAIRRLLDQENFVGTIQFVDFDARKHFGHLKSLHGDWTSYGRLLIPDYIDRELVLYLDADLIVSVDVLELKTFPLNNFILGAVPSGKLGYTMEKDLFLDKLRLPTEASYFNAGVLLIDLKQWRKEHIQLKWKKITVDFPELLISHDQTLLNAICGGEFAFLPPQYNNHWFPGNTEPINANQSIVHFVGAPKPWDAFGKQLHKGYHLWKSYSPDWWNNQFIQVSWNKVLRTWRIRNSILLKMKSKIVG